MCYICSTYWKYRKVAPPDTVVAGQASLPNHYMSEMEIKVLRLKSDSSPNQYLQTNRGTKSTTLNHVSFIKLA